MRTLTMIALVLVLGMSACNQKENKLAKEREAMHEANLKVNRELELQKAERAKQIERKVNEKRRNPITVTGIESGYSSFGGDEAVLKITIKNNSDKDIKAFRMKATYYNVFDEFMEVYEHYFADSYSHIEAHHTQSLTWEDDDRCQSTVK